MSIISMQVIKRNGSKEDVSFDKVLNRIRIVADGLEVNPTLIAQRTLLRIYDGVKTSELDELAAQLSISLMTTNLDYGILASRIIISNNHKCTSPSFSETIYLLYNKSQTTTEMINKLNDTEFYELGNEHYNIIKNKIIFS